MCSPSEISNEFGTLHVVGASLQIIGPKINRNILKVALIYLKVTQKFKP
jgi:hypothetical protein